MHFFEVVVEVKADDTSITRLAAINSREISLDGVEHWRVELSQATHHSSEV